MRIIASHHAQSDKMPWEINNFSKNPVVEREHGTKAKLSTFDHASTHPGSNYRIHIQDSLDISVCLSRINSRSAFLFTFGDG
jgi:hypothetical protein